MLLAAMLTVLAAPVALAQQPPQPDPPVAGDSISDIIFSGGIVGFLIVALLLLLSMGGLALAVEHVITIRRSVLMPEELVTQLRELLSQGQVGQAVQRCDATPCALASMMKAALVEAESGWAAVEKGLEEETAEQAGRLFRKIEYLSVLGNIAPMVGLLGTVIGMIMAFREVADTQGAARAGELASGIYQALVTTVGGLLIAIPSLAAYAVFRNRVDGLVAECMATAKGLLVPVKRALLNRKA
ncbi:MotA/TolQ/ExbB proton channel family protein [Aeoliella sp. ICT_H6.2]|uniref:MotA/TolQ/ExbB proton channel family protein n=1 Tax=Aeoliella straminimaris TaxID=2954799 RepID=A0A9X2JK23_9BACT|nr:MotA/TolQ/ExbB proton channel family protein [Aeoliella straminimaris]MCO6045734.1 MotA/TolQ/ExbB proton channel family protein [Aeoliella straminimaris]